MSENANPARNHDPEIVTHAVRLLGTGAADPTKVFGTGLTVVRQGAAGLLRVTFTEAKGKYLGFLWSLSATTPGDNKGHTVVAKDIDVTTPAAPFIDVQIYDSAFAAEDLEAAEWLYLEFKFQKLNQSHAV